MINFAILNQSRIIHAQNISRVGSNSSLAKGSVVCKVTLPALWAEYIILPRISLRITFATSPRSASSKFKTVWASCLLDCFFCFAVWRRRQKVLSRLQFTIVSVTVVLFCNWWKTSSSCAFFTGSKGNLAACLKGNNSQPDQRQTHNQNAEAVVVF